MDILSKINNTALGYNSGVAVKAVNRMAADIVRRDNHDYEPSQSRTGEYQYAVPLRLALSSSPDDTFTLPLDPIVSISSSNLIVKREIAKSTITGTVKEKWSNDDWKISVSGVLKTMGDADDEQVEYYIDRLRKLITSDEALVIECDVLNNVFDITRVVVESYSFPFTKGIENQSFMFSLLSDDSYDLEVE